MPCPRTEEKLIPAPAGGEVSACTSASSVEAITPAPPQEDSSSTDENAPGNRIETVLTPAPTATCVPNTTENVAHSADNADSNNNSLPVASTLPYSATTAPAISPAVAAAVEHVLNDNSKFAHHDANDQPSTMIPVVVDAVPVDPMSAAHRDATSAVTVPDAGCIVVEADTPAEAAVSKSLDDDDDDDEDILRDRIPSGISYKDQALTPEEILRRERLGGYGVAAAAAGAATTITYDDDCTTTDDPGIENIVKRARGRLERYWNNKLKAPPSSGTNGQATVAQKKPALPPSALEILGVAVAGQYQVVNSISSSNDPNIPGKFVPIRHHLELAMKNTVHYHYNDEVLPRSTSSSVTAAMLKKVFGSSHSDNGSATTQQVRNTCNSRTKVQVMNATTVRAALELAHRPDYMAEDSFKLGILNFASPTQPGGGFLRGIGSQEASLSLTTLLYPCLEAHFSSNGHDEESYPQDQTYYKVNARETKGGLYTDCAFVSPDVPIVRSEDPNSTSECRYTWLEKPVLATIVTLPAPNRNQGGASEKEFDDTLKRRIKRALDLFILHGCTHLILGSYGCGVFGNPPKTVAVEFKKALTKRHKSFGHVVFAILARNKKQGETLRTFEEVFNSTVL